jgi:hypothetical protein
MAVAKQLNRTDTIVLTGPLNELYDAAGPIIEDYLSRNWTFQNSKTEPNAGPRMELRFLKERESQ